MVVLVVAVIALHDPKNPSSSQAGSGSGSKTPSASSSTAGSPGTATSGASSSSSPGSTDSTAPALTDAQLKAQFPLVVLNNTTISGLASEAATRFEQGGWTVDHVGNLTNDIISTCAYYDPSVAHARAAATALRRQYPTIQRVEPRFDGLDDGPVVVVLTPDYSSS